MAEENYWPPGWPPPPLGNPGFPGGWAGPGTFVTGVEPGQGPRPPVMTMPKASEMGGNTPGVPPWVQIPFFPTRPYWSTKQDVAHEPRFYRVTLLSTDSDYVAGTTATRTQPIDLPCKLIALNAGVWRTSGAAFPVGWSPRTCFNVRVGYTNGAKLHVELTNGDAVCGTAERPGELGAAGFPFSGGSSAFVEITPILSDLSIHLVLHCLEMRPSTNHR